ncbi:MAG: MMPL family transporter [Gammaproteobacteria bacterium]|nr:MMPL family transporter [Gammaproteobacteria bacterium]MCP5140086.1 MMPL family transporter [Chromatiales bacterium]
MSEPQGFFPRFGNALFDHRKLVLLIVMLITAWFAWHIPTVRMLSDFADLLPQQHPYIKLHNSIRDTFGGANIITMAVEVDEGTVFTNETLSRIHRITEGMDKLTSINHNLVTSLTHRNTRKISLTPDGNIRSKTYYDPQYGDYSPDELAGMQRDVVASPRVFGLLVSPDLKAAIIKGTLNEGALDYGKIFEELQAIRLKEAAPGVRIYATGNPVLVGWVDSYSVQILQIFLYTVVIVLAILIVYTRRLYGILLPLFGMALTSIWGVGFMGVLGYNLDPLMLVVPFLISARALSHGIQKVERYFLELARTDDRQLAARNTFNALFRPGALAIVADAAALFLIGLGSVPINDKMAIYASFWAVSMVVTVLVTLPMLLAILPKPKNISIKRTIIRDVFPKLALVVGTRERAKAVLWVTLCIVLVATALSFRVQIGEPEPGSPLLYRDHDFNVSSKAINDRFPGSEELFIIARTDEKGGLKRPEVIKALADFQNYMLLDPTMGGAKGLNNLVIQVNQMTRNDDPRWAVVPNRASDVGGLMFMYMMSAPVPGALLEYLDTDEQLANMVFYYKDHTGETIRRAIHMVKQWRDEVGNKIPGLHIDLAGGPVGVTAAINEEAFDTNLVVVPAVLVLILMFTFWFYGSIHSGVMMLVSMGFATTLTYACMGLLDMGLNVNTVPMIAVGIGLGVDYAIYMMDRIKEEMHGATDLQEAVKRAVSTTGVAIAFTATTLIGGIIMWVFISELRFQADSARLLIIMLVLNACSAMFLVPAWVEIFKPKFIMGTANERGANGSHP